MLRVGQYVFKRAETSQEFEQIHRLNHRTFVEEIPQHRATGTGALVDKFHHKNFYIIVLRDDRVVGMVSAHDQPPFSIAERLPEPGILVSDGTRPLEVRLLAIEPDERNSTLFFGLIWTLYENAREEGYTHLFISGVEERVAMYERLGFVRLGPAVACGDAAFVPMVYTIGKIPLKMQRVKRRWEMHVAQVSPKTKKKLDSENVCLLPGPVTMSRAVRDAFSQPPIYHRGPEFIHRFVQVREHLARIVNGHDVAILNGSGTLANESIAATLAALPNRGKGVLLINGEFGERLAKQAIRFGLTPHTLEWKWGEPWDLEQVEQVLAREPEGSWVWGVHQESSTGVLNDLAGLVRIAKKHGIRLCVDCISSLGAVPLDLSEVFLASGASGKSVGSYAGAALLFAKKEELRALDRSKVPSYFDIFAALSSEGPCYTFPSPTLTALEAALQEYATVERCQATYARYNELGVRVRQELRRVGLTPLADEDYASPVITTFAPPAEESSASFVARCRLWGYAIGGESAYLSRRRLVQIATMGAVHWDIFGPLFDHLESWLAKTAFLAGV
ncbi:MAG: aminotransferase class V-fold PLP-dependent enzyme [Gemmataceae bacterium]|nr:aminotransferase class V-fold PLP-dependent enzyme [Gemmataceae bacterium]MCI0741022.1 aminotransferase class V-fold PLP-dependent enzyme [Gemmataceae bacterium]